jgi:hypothetical protein
MALGSTQPLTEMNTRNLPGGKETSKKAGSKQILQIVKGFCVKTSLRVHNHRMVMQIVMSTFKSY